jgi:hypothetical protein
MKITREWAVKQNACQSGLVWYDKQGEDDVIALVKLSIKQGKGPMLNMNWALVRLMDKIQRVRYAVFAAEQVIGIYEAKYPKDRRPRKAIAAAKKWAEEPTEENRKAAAKAAYAAAAAADAAYTSASADSAYAAAYTFAAPAFAASARLRLMVKILRYGVKILMEKGDK